MGRHRAPLPEGDSTLPRVPIAIATGALLVVVVLLTSVFVAMRGGGDDTVTARTSTQKSSTPKSSTPSPTATPAASASASAPAAASAPATAKRPPTLHLTMVGKSYVTVRSSKGRTLVSKLFHKGQRKTFDLKELSVLLGNSAAVQVTVNGKLRKPGHKGQVATFTVRRK